MKNPVPPALALALVFSALVSVSCVADSSLATTPVVTPTLARPTAAIPANTTPVLPPPPVAPAAGTYFGTINAVDLPSATLTFSPICVGADRKVMRELAQAEQAPRIVPLLSTTALSVFTAPPNNPAAGRLTTVDLPALARELQTNPGAKWFMTVNPQGVANVEQDSGVRPAGQPDDPCPRG